MVRAFRKKYIIWFFIGIGAFAPLLFCQNDQEYFLQANKYYAEKEYDKALETYHMMSKKGGAVLYNMGNCYFHQQDYPYALVYWSRAEVGATSNEYSLIQHNKQLALKKLGKQKEQAWWTPLIDFLESPLPNVSLLVIQLFFLFCWFIFIFGMRTKQTGHKKVAKGLVSVCIIILALTLGLHYTHSDIDSAIVVKKDAQLFAGPDKSFHVLSPLVYADAAAVKETRTGWYKIQYADMIGWVEEDVIQII